MSIEVIDRWEGEIVVFLSYYRKASRNEDDLQHESGRESLPELAALEFVRVFLKHGIEVSILVCRIAPGSRKKMTPAWASSW